MAPCPGVMSTSPRDHHRPQSCSTSIGYCSAVADIKDSSASTRRARSARSARTCAVRCPSRRVRCVALGDTPQVVVGETEGTRDVRQRRAGALLFSAALDLAQRGHRYTRSFREFALCDPSFLHPVVHDLRDISPMSQVGHLRASPDRRLYGASGRQRIHVTLHPTPITSALDSALNSAYCSPTSSRREADGHTERPGGFMTTDPEVRKAFIAGLRPWLATWPATRRRPSRPTAR